MPAPAPDAPAALPLGNYYWVLPDQLLAGEHPCGATPELTRERLAALTAAGISCFIDLTEPHEMPAYADALPPGVLYHRRAIPDHGLPAETATMTAILECILAALRGGQRVYLHCRAGIGRTGMTVGCLLAEGGVGGGGGDRGAEPPVAPEPARAPMALGSGDRCADRLRAQLEPARAAGGRSAPGARDARGRARTAHALPRRAPGARHGRCGGRGPPVPPPGALHARRRHARRRALRPAARRLER